jgi:serine/threonine protein kinase
LKDVPEQSLASIHGTENYLSPELFRILYLKLEYNSQTLFSLEQFLFLNEKHGIYLEALKSTGEYDPQKINLEKCDLFSLGVILRQLLTLS